MGVVERSVGTVPHTRWLRVADLSPADVQAWRDLGERALEPNAYLSADMVVPALQHLDRAKSVHLLLIHPHAADARLIGAMALENTAGTSDMPVPHLRVYHSLHAFLGGLLVDRDHAALAIRALFAFLERNRLRWHGVEVPQTWASGPLHDLVAAACAAHHCVHSVDVMYQRPVLHSAQLDAALHSKRGRLRDLARRERRLGEMGSVQWRWVLGRDVTVAQVSAFLSLEHKGWKGSLGTSMLSQPAQVAYFGNVVDRLAAQGQVFFTELLLDGRPIASTCNFVAGDTAHAFKVAWDPAFARFAPGFLGEVEIMRNARRMIPHVATFESGGSDAAYVADLWTSRRPLANVTIATSALGRNSLRAKALYVATRGHMQHGVAQAALVRYDAIPLIDHAIDRLSWFI
jgi:CelD/BcsL family acetyltransferase involved in cellulose biosynthesis